MASPHEGPRQDGLFYIKAAGAGALAASLTHFVMVPVDVVKTRMQLQPAVYPSLPRALASIVRTEGAGALALGMAPTNYGYLLQGFCKYGLYELFKTSLAKGLGQETAERHATLVYLAAGMAAETVADVALTPFEAVRIRVVSQPAFAASTLAGMRKIAAADGVGGLYKGYVPLVLKQVPYTAVKFAVFEKMEEIIYGRVVTRARSELSNAAQLGVTAVSGFVGGVVSAVASHPADTMLTRVNVAQGNVFASVAGAARQLGFTGLWVGLMPRMGMVGVLAALQLLVYDFAKVTFFGLATSQGIKKAPVVSSKGLDSRQ